MPVRVWRWMLQEKWSCLAATVAGITTAWSNDLRALPSSNSAGWPSLIRCAMKVKRRYGYARLYQRRRLVAACWGPSPACLRSSGVRPRPVDDQEQEHGSQRGVDTHAWTQCAAPTPTPHRSRAS